MRKSELGIIISADDNTKKGFGGASKSVQDFESDLGRADKSMFDLSGTAGALGGVLAGATAGGIVAVAGATTAFGLAVMDVSGQAMQAQRELQGELGVTADEAEMLSDVAVDVFANNFGDSVLGVKNTIVEVKQQLRGLSDDELQDATENAYRLSDAFGIETGESINAVKALMENFGLSSDEAFSMVANGFQAGLNSSDDFLDSITEYSNQFADGGATADEFFNTMASGLSTGMLGTDKAADLFKEFTVRIQDGSSLTAESLEALGINSKEMLSQLADGTIEPIDAFNEVQTALSKTDDEALFMQAGVGLLGTQLEDLGMSAVKGIDTMTDQWDKSGEALDEIDTRYNDFGSMLQGTWREVLVAFKPFGDRLLEFGNQILPPLLDKVGEFADYLIQFFTSPEFTQFIEETWANLSAEFERFGKEILPELEIMFDNFMIMFKEDLLPVIEEVWTKISTEILPRILPTITRVIQFINEIWPIIRYVFSTSAELIGIVVDQIIANWDFLLTFFNGAMDIISGLLNGDFKQVAQGFKDIFGGMVDWVIRTFGNLGRALKIQLNIVIDMFNGLIDKIPEIPGIGKIGKIPRFANGGEFTTSGPMMMMVGDNPGGKERVSITPTSSPNFNGPKSNQGGGGNTININFPNKPIFIKSDKDMDELAKELKKRIK